MGTPSAVVGWMIPGSVRGSPAVTTTSQKTALLGRAAAGVESVPSAQRVPAGMQRTGARRRRPRDRIRRFSQQCFGWLRRRCWALRLCRLHLHGCVRGAISERACKVLQDGQAVPRDEVAVLEERWKFPSWRPGRKHLVMRGGLVEPVVWCGEQNKRVGATIL